MAPLPASLERYRRCGTGVVIPVALAHHLGGIALATPLLEVGPQGASQPLQAAAIPRMSRLAMPYLSPWSSYLCCLPAQARLASRAALQHCWPTFPRIQDVFDCRLGLVDALFPPEAGI
jgi:hypothetical protein